MNLTKKTMIILTAMLLIGPPNEARADMVGPISRAISGAFQKFMTAWESKAGGLASEESAFSRFFLRGAIRFTAPRGEKILDLIGDTPPMDTTISLSQWNALPNSVDLRPWDNPIQNQQQEGMCVAFAIAAVLESKIATTKGTKMKLSERQIWSFFKVPNIKLALRSIDNKAIFTDDVWPFDTTRPRKQIAQKSARFKALDPDALLGLAIDTITVTNAMEMLSLGVPLVLATETTKAFESPILNRGARQGHIGVGAAGTDSGHAMAIVGYKKDITIAGGGYFIVRNSWGEKWGDRGYGYLPFDHCRAHPCVAWAIASDVTVSNVPINVGEAR